MQPQGLLSLLLASVVVVNVGGVISLYLNSLNSLSIVLAASVIRGILGVGVGSFLFYHFGLVGFGMGILGGELLVLLVMGRYFVKHELSQHSVNLPLRSFAPITLRSCARISAP